MADLVKLQALDETDLTIISALAQDAVLKVGDIDYSAGTRKLILSMNRYAWELPGARRWLFPKKERRLCVLHFDRVSAVRTQGFDVKSKEVVLALLSIEFEESSKEHDPSGTLNLTFSGGATLAADVECVEGKLTDLGAAWGASRRPRHAGGEDL